MLRSQVLPPAHRVCVIVLEWRNIQRASAEDSDAPSVHIATSEYSGYAPIPLFSRFYIPPFLMSRSIQAPSSNQLFAETNKEKKRANFPSKKMALNLSTPTAIPLPPLPSQLCDPWFGSTSMMQLDDCQTAWNRLPVQEGVLPYRPLRKSLLDPPSLLVVEKHGQYTILTFPPTLPSSSPLRLEN